MEQVPLGGGTAWEGWGLWGEKAMDRGARKKGFSSRFISQSDAIAQETQHLEKVERKGKFLGLNFCRKERNKFSVAV